MKDVKPTVDEEERKTRFLTRAQAAYSLTVLSSVDPINAANAVTDAGGDQGLDAIYFDGPEKTLYLVQSKWSKQATKSIEQGDCGKFINGIQQLIKGDFSGFNERILNRKTELEAFLRRSDVRITLVLVYSSSQPLSDPVSTQLNQFLEQQNNVGDIEVFSLEVLNLERLYAYISGSATTNKIKLEIALSEWGTIQSPYRAYYGQVRISDIVTWASHGKQLFDRNVRFYRGATDVNTAIEDTLAKSPEHFWYFNNGITMLCSKLEKKIIGGDSRDVGIFDCMGVSVVNGAQTVGVIWDSAKHATPNPQAKINVRLISLENCPESFGLDVTRGTNTQNRFQNRDFAALDPIQARLASEMEMDGKRYSFKSGDLQPDPQQGCDIEEATVAIACANEDISLAAQAKREIGALWRDIAKPPYTTLFNDDLSARHMWMAVKIARVVERELEGINKKAHVRGELVAVHGNRFILHMVFRDPEVRRYRDSTLSEAVIMEATRKATQKIFEELAQVVEINHQNAYLANVFKNAAKYKDLESALKNGIAQKQAQPRLF
jgi:hypothetical protein